VATGLHCLHENNVLHRDLKPANILLKRNSGQLTAVISDFGSLKGIDLLMTENRGTPMYVDPTLAGTNNYGTEWDVYSFGLIIYEVLTGKFIIDIADAEKRSIERFRKVMQTTL
jgi:serine/threonine-protein kinase TNNI3K